MSESNKKVFAPGNTKPGFNSIVFASTAIVWTALCVLSLMWNLNYFNHSIDRIYLHVARSNYEVDNLYRMWNSSVDGIYISVDDKEGMNFMISDTTVMKIEHDSLSLVRVNPDQMSSMARSAFPGLSWSIIGLDDMDLHITDSASLCMRSSEMIDHVLFDGTTYINYTRPIVAEKECMSCHTGSAFAEGDILGARGISMPVENLQALVKEQGTPILLVHLFLWLGGLGLFWMIFSLVFKERKNLSLMRETAIANELKYRSLLENLTIGIFRVEYDTEPDLIQANKALIAMLGYGGFQEMISLPFTIHFKNPETFLDMVEDVTVRGTVKDREVKLIRMDGTTFWASLTMTLEKGSSGSSDTISGIIEDIDKKKMAEENNLRVLAAVEGSMDAVMITDTWGRAIYQNVAFSALYGHSIESLNDHGIETIFSNRELFYDVKKGIYDGGKFFSGEIVTKSWKDEEFKTMLYATKITDHKGEFIGVLYMFSDISEKIKAEQDRMMKERFRGSLEMAGTACHELNQPLQVILGYSDLLFQSTQEDSTQNQYAETIRAQTQRMAKIVRKLSSITKYKTMHYAGSTDIFDLDRSN